MHMLTRLTPLLLAVSLFGAAPDTEKLEALKTGDAAAAALLKNLGGNLKKHMKAGGPSDALAFCSTQAISLTQDTDSALGEKVSVKRITLKPRNPGNGAVGTDKAVLEALHTLHQNGVDLPPHLLKPTAEGYRYYKPLVINNPVCLKCHGSDVNPALKTQIDKSYGSDMAIGYKMGDLRGAIVVDIKK